MNEFIARLRASITGEVSTDSATRDFFSTDGSVFTLNPSLVVYPQNEADVVETVQLVAREAASGKVIPITARGKGTDQGGGSLGSGLMMVFPAHMNHFVTLDKNTVTVQPGMIYKDLQHLLHSHGRFLPPYPASIDFATIGGAVANNSAGEKTVKYGSTRDYVESMRVVLANGDIIETRRLSPKDLKSKMRQTDFEGHIYRNIDYLINENWEILSQAYPRVSKNSAGYDLWHVKGPDGSFDLGQLIVGSQGTLGVVTEIQLRHVEYNPHTQLLVGFFETMEEASQAVEAILPLHPSALEVVDKHLLEFLRKHDPEQIHGVIPEKIPGIVLLVQFDDAKRRLQIAKAKKTAKVFTKFAYDYRHTDNPSEQTKFWKIRRGAAAIIWKVDGAKKALPIIEDAVVPLEVMPLFLEKVYKLFAEYKLDIAVWGHAGNANFHLQPFMNLGSAVGRKQVFELMNDFYRMVIEMGGSTCGEHNDGRLRAPYLKRLYGEEIYSIFTDVKKVFDPLNILNPGVKMNVQLKDIQPLLRKEYSMKHLAEYLPNNYDN
ncbi:FAD-binding oxidoreductase [Candidatus Saccharibacteria bacterium]|nr:FAD-binding oxidoreductase [Candidatus Saccharibacteria bacterium]